MPGNVLATFPRYSSHDECSTQRKFRSLLGAQCGQVLCPHRAYERVAEAAELSWARSGPKRCDRLSWPKGGRELNSQIGRTVGLCRTGIAFLIGFCALMVPGAPHALAAGANYYTYSHYEHDASTSRLNQQGCNDAANIPTYIGTPTANVALLDFGRPALSGSTYGTVGIGGGFISNASILAGVESYASGFITCLTVSGTRVAVALGVNNSCPPNSGCLIEPTNFYTAGVQWVTLVNSFQSWLSSRGYTTWINVAGADDAEPAWDPAYTSTQQWIQGFNTGSPSYAMFDYGSQDGGSTSASVPPNSYWSWQQRYYVAWGAGVDYPFGEIYQNPLPAQWQALDDWSHQQGYSFIYYGDLSDYNPSVNPNCGWDPGTSYNMMLSALQSKTDTWQSGISYWSNIFCSQS